MKNEVIGITESVVDEFNFFDGEDFITFDIIEINWQKDEVCLAVTNRGKISILTYDILKDSKGREYFEYGPALDRIMLDDVREVSTDEAYTY